MGRGNPWIVEIIESFLPLSLSLFSLEAKFSHFALKVRNTMLNDSLQASFPSWILIKLKYVYVNVSYQEYLISNISIDQSIVA